MFYRRIFDGPIDIKWFGVKGDADINDVGTDDTLAIKKAISVLSNIYKPQKMSGGNIYGCFTLYFPHGIYFINETLLLPEGTNIEEDSYKIR